MRTGNRINWLGLFAVLCLIISGALFLFEVVVYSRTYSQLPAGLTLGGVPVGGLTVDAARAQLLTAYNAPVELQYLDRVILLDPQVVNFEVNAGVMLPQAGRVQSNTNFWTGLWDYLWLQPPQVRDVPLKATYSQEKLRAFLEDLAARYDRPGNPPQADADHLGFKPGAPGHTLNVEAALDPIGKALLSPEDRVVALPLIEQTTIQPSFATLGELLTENTKLSQFDGVMTVHVADLKTGEELNLLVVNGAPLTGTLAFSAMSTIKIPIMVSLFANREGDLNEGDNLLLQRSIDESQNTSTDLLLKTIGAGDGFAGTRQVTADMERLGLVNTYISGLLDVAGAVLSPKITPANSRADLSTQPDLYNQTTAEDMGALLVMIYQCSQGKGALLAAFPGRFAPERCQRMIQLLTDNQVGPIFIKGGSPGAVVAHKHGWDTVPLTNLADAALVFTPGGNYVFTLYVHRTETIGYEEANRLIISMARAVHNFYNAKPAAK